MDHKEKYTLSLVRDKVNTVFDIGAREDGIEFIEIVPNGEFHFFEPNKDFADSLKSKIPVGANAIVNQYGMWFENMDMAKYYMNTQSFIPHPFGISVDSGHLFNLRTIDWYVKENNIKSIDYLKIDAEGADYKILQGASNSIKLDMIKYLQFEYWDGVKKFYDLLQNKYDMFFIDPSNDQLRALTSEVIHHIDNERIPSGAGGDIFCAHKKEEFKG